MKPTEAVALCRMVKAYCPQQAIDEYTADAYGDILAPYRLEDCQDAIRNLGRTQAFIAPAEIAEEVRRIRSKRVADYGVIDPPAGLDPDDVRGYQQWLGAKTRAIADGIDTAPVIPEGLRQHDVIAELGHIGKAVPDA